MESFKYFWSKRQKQKTIMIQAYLYPLTSRSSGGSNPYLKDFITSLSEKIDFINLGKPSSIGIIDIFRYLGTIDIIFLNWIEDLPEKKAGIIQSLVFILLIHIISYTNIKIFYILHNKESHYPRHRFLKKLIKDVVISKSDFVLFHASEGVEILKKYKFNGKYKYIPHPFNINYTSNIPKTKEYDILIWGAIREYKGIDKFLNYLEKEHLIEKYSILIAGDVYPKEYLTSIKKHESKNIKIEAHFIEDSHLDKIIMQSRIVLFTYNDKSVLSSGALIYSLSRRASVIGPNTGSFCDLYNEGLIEVFNNYDELIEKINFKLYTQYYESDSLNKYIIDNSWQKFGKEIFKWISV